MAEWVDYIIYQYPYWVSVVLMMVGLYGVINASNLVKKLIGMSIFQVSVLLFYISLAYRDEGYVPILTDGQGIYVNPLPHVLMLTAIVVGIATLAVGLALVIRIKEAYNTIEEDDIIAVDRTVASDPLLHYNALRKKEEDA